MPATKKSRRPSPSRADADGADADWVCVGVIARPKGVRGAGRVTTYTARPEDIAAYGPLHDEPGGPTVTLELREVVKGGIVAAVPGVTDRDAAEDLRGTRLYVPRAALPEPEEDEYYHVDLVGLRAELTDGTAFGAVTAVHDFGAGDIVEIAPAGGGATVMLSFTREVVPVVDLAGGRLVVSPPEETVAGKADEEEKDEG